MKKISGYILLSIFILQSTAFDQLLKLPVLVSHFQEHQQRDERISVTAFLSMHYWGKDLDDNDDERDMQLPYKKVDIHGIQYTFVPLARVVSLKQFTCRQTKIYYPVLKDNYLPEPALSTLFRPPRA